MANKKVKLSFVILIILMMAIFTFGCAYTDMNTASEEGSVEADKSDSQEKENDFDCLPETDQNIQNEDEGKEDISSNENGEAEESWMTEDPYDTVSDVKTSDDAIFYFLDGLLVGSYENGKWYSMSAGGTMLYKYYYAQDILSKIEYKIYRDGQSIGLSNIIYMEPYFGLGDDLIDYSEELETYGEHKSYGYCFKLPTQLGPEIPDLLIPDYSYYFYFTNDYNYDHDKNLVTNSEDNLYPRSMTKDVEVPDAIREALISLFKENQMENTFPYFTECVSGDFDNDGNDEMVAVANSPVNKWSYPMLEGYSAGDAGFGFFSVLLYTDDDGNTYTVYSDLRPFPANDNYNGVDIDYCQYLELQEIADLNSNGLFEITVHKQEWEWGSYYVFALDDGGNYKTVMISHCGM